MSDTRESYFDVAKFMAMLGIVFIHVRTYAPQRVDGWLIVGLENFVMTFVVPLFMLVSGYFSRRLFESGDVKKLLFRAVACLWPVLTVNVFACMGLMLAFDGALTVPAGGWIRYVLSTGWFFFCLVLCDGLTFFAHWISRGRAGVRFAVELAAYVVLLVLPVGMFHARELIPFFWFGLYVYPIFRRWKNGPTVGLAAQVTFLLVCGLLPDFQTIGLELHAATEVWKTITMKGCGQLGLRLLIGLAGALGVLETLRILTSRVRAVEFLARFGSQTMRVFFLHLLLLVVYYRFVGWTGAGPVGRLMVAVVVFFIAYGLSVLTRLNLIVNAVLWNPTLLWRKPLRPEVVR